MNETLKRYAVPLVIVIAIVQFFLMGYDFGLDAQIEKLPQIYRMLDSDYLTNDPFVNACERWTPRIYFNHVMATLGRVISVELAFLLVELLAAVAIALTTYLFATGVVRLSPLGGICASIMSIQGTAIIAGSAFLFHHHFLPAALGVAAALPALLQAFRGRPMAAAAFNIAAIFVHPQIGLFTSAAVVAALCFGKLRGEIKTSWPRIVAFLLITAAVFIALWHPYLTASSEGRISDQEFIDIYARFFVPYHVLPCSIPLYYYMMWAAFWGVALVAAFLLRRDAGIRIPVAGMSAITVLILLACVFAFVSIELMGNRLGATLQPLRMTLLPDWFAIIFVGGLAGKLFERADRPAEVAAAMLLIIGMGPKILTVVGIVLYLVVRLLRRWIPSLNPAAVAILSLAVFIFAFTKWTGPQLYWLKTLAGVAIVAVVVMLRTPKLVYGTLAAGLAALLALAAINPHYKIPLLNRFLPQSYTLADNAVYHHPLYEFIRESTEPDAVFIVPYEHRHVRLLCSRAFATAYRGMVFYDAALKDWYERFLAVYGRVIWANGHYFRLSDEQLADIASKYGVDYAIMKAGKRSRFQAVFLYKNYKILDLRREIPAPPEGS